MPTILGANTLSTGYDVANSLRFDDGSSAYLNRTPSSASNRTTWTWSAWIKRSNLTGGQMALFGAKADSSNDTGIWLQSDDTLQFFNNVSGTVKQIRTNRLFRDSTAWYHIVAVWDSDNGTAGNRMRLYINGVEETSFGTDTNPGSGDNSTINNTEVHQIGRVDTTYYFDGYMAEVCFIDGQALDATSFGEFDEDSPTQWKPKKVSTLTFGTNGFYLEFKQSGTSQNSSGMGADTSGNDNHYATGGLAAVDQSIDTCTNNFATLNPLDVTRLSNVGNTFTEGNLVVTDGSSNYLVANGSIAVEAGKWYFEVKMIESTDTHIASGVMVVNLDADDKTDGAANGNHGWLYATNGQKRNAGSSSNYGDTYTQNDIIGVALDMDNKAIYFSKNGTFQASGDPTSGASKTNAAYTNLAGTITAQVYDGQGSEAHEFSMNFGSPHHAVSSGNADANGYGNFEYTVPSGYFALCTKNLAEYG